MAKKIRFPLSLPDGAQARSLDELQEHFDLEAVLGHYKSGKLLTWLRDRYNEEEADALEALDEAAPDFQRRLCEVLGVEFTGSGADLEEIARRQERLAKLRQFTDEDEFILGIDFVAFDQEELADLLDEGCEKIYLCGERFTVPAFQRNKTYVGVNSPTVRISGTVGSDWAERNITFDGCQVDNLPKLKVIEELDDVENTIIHDSDQVINKVSETIADQIYENMKPATGPDPFYIETDNYIVWEASTGIYAISKGTGEKTSLLLKSQYPNRRFRRLDIWPHFHDTILAFLCDEEGNYSDTQADVFSVDIANQKVTNRNFKVPSFQCAAFDGKFLAVAEDKGPLTVIDLKLQRKYQLCRKSCGRDGSMTFLDQSLFFISAEHDLVRYSLNQKQETVLSEIPCIGGRDATADFFAIAHS